MEKIRTRRQAQPIGCSIRTELGELSCEVHADPDFPGLTIYWNGRQIAVIEAGKPVMRVIVWDTDAEDPSAVLPVFPGYGEDGPCQPTP